MRAGGGRWWTSQAREKAAEARRAERQLHVPGQAIWRVRPSTKLVEEMRALSLCRLARAETGTVRKACWGVVCEWRAPVFDVEASCRAAVSVRCCQTPVWRNAHAPRGGVFFCEGAA